MRALALRVVILWGWRRALVALVAGAFGALAMPPFGLFPALAVSFTVAIWLLDGATGPAGRLLPALRAAFGIGFCFGFGYFLAGLWWVGQAFLVDADQFGRLMPIAVVGLPLLLAPFPALGFMVARLLWASGPTRLFAFAAGLSLAEWLRGHLLTGFPWNAFGYALAGEVHLAQGLAIVGLPGLTVLTILILGAPALLADDAALSPWSRRVVAFAAAGLVAMAALGVLRLAAIQPTNVANVKLRIMQPAISQDDKFRPAMRNEILTRYRDLSNRTTGPDNPGLAGVTHLIWPESAFPFIVSRDAEALSSIADLLPPGAILITGAGRAEDAVGDGEERYYNSVHIIDSTGVILDTYDKVRLVPFGEFLPFQSTLEAHGLRDLTQQRGGFSPGPGIRTLDVPNAPPVGVLVCYEAIFPGEVVDPARRPGWLLNVTNDAWFGMTPGPFQHFAQARARAIEEGLPLVRAGNDGISAVIDPAGRVLASLALGATGVLDSPLPSAIDPTIYARVGDVVFAILLACCVIIPLVGRRAA